MIYYNYFYILILLIVKNILMKISLYYKNILNFSIIISIIKSIYLSDISNIDNIYYKPKSNFNLKYLQENTKDKTSIDETSNISNISESNSQNNALTVEKDNNNNNNNNNYINCGYFICPSSYAKCSGKYNEACICNDEYDSYPFDTYEKCFYKKKQQLIAFLLELFITFGAGHIYAENYTIGILKAFFFVIACFNFISIRIWNKKTEENNTSVLLLGLTGFILCVVIIIWQIVDIILLGLNRYIDGNGITLYPMV